MDKLDYLISYLLNENKEVKISRMPDDKKSKHNLYRSLCNIRDAKPIDDVFVKVENEYLQETLKNKQVTNVKNIKTISEMFVNTNIKNENKICIWQGDMTTLEIEAVVNPANSQGLGCFVALHSCLDNQLNSNAGVCLRLECNEIMKNKDYNLRTGEAIITKAYNLPSKYVIHTVGPIIYNQVSENDKKLLANCYINCLELAREKQIKTIAFPCISTGEFRFPKKNASQIAIDTVDQYLNRYRDEFEKIVFNVWSDEDISIYEQNLTKI